MNPLSTRLRARIKRAAALSLLSLLFCSNITFALDSDKSIAQYVRDTFVSEQGLPQNTVVSVVQTPDGYIWAATQEGLARFDGVQFTIFDSHNTPELKSGMMSKMN